MAKPKTAGDPNPTPEQIKFKMIACGPDSSLYALDEENRVFYYLDDDKSQGWYQLEYDDVREALVDD